MLTDRFNEFEQQKCELQTIIETQERELFAKKSYASLNSSAQQNNDNDNATTDNSSNLL